MKGLERLVRTPAAALLICVMAGCTAAGTDVGPVSAVEQCRAGDQEVASEMNCLQDDAACYQLADGNWCTGPRAASCPAGSTPLEPGSECPTGARCIALSESLACVVGGS